MALVYSCIIVLHLAAYNIYLKSAFGKGTGTESDPTQLFVTPGHEAILQCNYDDHKLRWQKKIDNYWSVIADGYDVINITKYKVYVNPNTVMPSKLHVLNAQSDDELIYRCMSSINTFYFLQLTLYVMPLMPVFSVPIVNTSEMVPFSISCTSTGSRPAATIWWMVGQTEATHTASSQENKCADETFNVTSTLTHMGNRIFNLQPIICTVINTIGEFSNQIDLFVRYPPDVSVSKINYDMTDLTRTINCTANGYPDTYTFYKWQHKSMYGRIIRELDGEGILTLPIVPTTDIYQDNGEYVCTVSNGIQGIDGAEKRQGATHITVYAPLKPEPLSSSVIIGAVCGSLISIIVLMVVLTFVIIKKRKGHRQCETTVKFEKTDSNDHTHNYEEVQNSSGTQNESNINKDQSPIKHYEALGLQDDPNAYDNLSNEALQANRDIRPSRNYEKLGLKDAPNVYQDLTDKDSQKIGGQSSRTHYEDLGRKKEAYVYDDLNIEACEEITAKSPTQYYEELGVKNNPTVYSDLINADAENKVYENASKQWTQEN